MDKKLYAQTTADVERTSEFSEEPSQLQIKEHNSRTAAVGEFAHITSTGAYSGSAVVGYNSQISSTGDYECHLLSSGTRSKLVSTGHRDNLAATGYKSELHATGNKSRVITAGDSNWIAATGESSVAMAASTDCRAKAGVGGCIVLTWWDCDKMRYRAEVAYVEENGIKPDVWYTLNEFGEFVEA